MSQEDGSILSCIFLKIVQLAHGKKSFQYYFRLEFCRPLKQEHDLTLS